ncbi:MAG: AmmeMemoRadiSam system protein A [Bacteroidales bacterium]|nr:AmmeMemoRadiSam system protein A [Bacteroidales bacterium]
MHQLKTNYLNMSNFTLSEEEKKTLMDIAQQTLASHVSGKTSTQIDKYQLTENLKLKVGAFVTLYKNGDLRGCIGRFMPNNSLYKVVEDMTISAASYDSRFSPVSKNELGEIEIEISVLTPLQKISSIDEIEIGRDGIYIVKGGDSGTLLPKVASDNGWSKLEFLEYCSKYKAGIGTDGWKEAELFIYQAIVF